jgi:hypothetical protein
MRKGETTVFHHHFMGVGRWSRIYEQFIVLYLLFSSWSCGFWPDQGRIITVKVSGGPNAIYGIVGDIHLEQAAQKPLVMVLPTKYDARRDIVRDMNTIWAFQAKKRNWIFVCPASSQGFPFDRSDNAGFGLGGADSIPHVIEDLKSRGILKKERPFLVDLWGNGSGLTSVVDQARGVFGHVILAPSASVDMDIISAFGRSSSSEMTIVLGEGGHKKIDAWVEESEYLGEAIRIIRIPVRPPYRTDARDMTLEEIGAAYADHICDYIASEILKARDQ